ncbi:MAG: DUF305 domain-containing protein [Actinomycetota bacterium]|nr:DUF305 domain-containing protein [Actinomycetota bacterium]
MGPAHLSPKTKQTGEHLSPSRRWDEPPVLLALAAIVLGAVSLALLAIPRPPEDASAEAGFARDMSVHHAQAVEMAESVRDRTESEEIRTLATDIALTQQGQIGQMQGWLAVWGLPATGLEPPMSWMGHPIDGVMLGMATSEEIDRLREAPSEEADAEFLRLLVPHHQAVTQMGEAVLERTDRPEVEQLATAVFTAQQAEIKAIQDMLRSRGLSRWKVR